MRKLIMWNLISLDGCFEGEKHWDLSFHGLVWGKELEDFSAEQLASADMLIFGKNTYQGMADYWSKAENDPAEGTTARSMNALPKIVCSTSLERADWNNTTIVRDALVEIPRLKQEGDGNIFVFGSGILSESLMNANLFDEYRLVIVPVVLGKGKRLFKEGLDYRELTLLKSRQLTSGGVMVWYAPVSK